MLLQRLCAFRIQRVVPVVVLVQDRAEHVLCPVAEENASRLGVHIGFHAVIALQHSFHHGVRAGCFRVQLDQLGAHFVYRAHRAFIEHPSAAADAFFGQTAAKAAQLRLSGFQFAVSLQPCQIQCLPAAVLCQHIVRVHSKAAHALRQLHGLVKSGHIFHLPQPVQAAGCSCIPFGISDLCRHVPADGLACAVRYFPAGQLLLHLPLFRVQALLRQAIGLPHPAGLFRRAAFHPFPSVLHGSSAPAQLTFRLCLPRRSVSFHFFYNCGRILCFNCRIFGSCGRSLCCPLLCCHFPQYLLGLCCRFRQLNTVFFRKGSAVRFIGRIRCK